MVLSVCLCVGGQVTHVRICSMTSLWELGLNVDQLITYAVSSNPSGPLVEVLEVFHLTSCCQHVVCGQGGKSVAFVQQLFKGLGSMRERERPCFGIWMHRNLTPPMLTRPQTPPDVTS